MNRILSALTRKLGKYYLRKGVEYAFKCPFCNEKRENKYKLDVNLKLGVYHCHRCGQSGKVVNGLLRELGESEWVSHGPAPSPNPISQDVEISLPKGAKLFQDGEKDAVLLNVLLSSKGLDYKIGKSWYQTDDIFSLRHRVIIPIIEGGKIVCWVARTLTGEIPKEISPPSTISNKSHFVYGLDDIIEGDTLVIVEGIFDCEKVKSCGYKCVSILGSHISDIQIGKILAKSPSEIFLLFDGDTAGREGARNANTRIIERNPSMFWRVVECSLPEDKDPDDLTRIELENLLLYYRGNC